MIGLAAAMIILAFTFGTLVAMTMPILSAIVGLACGLALIGLLGHVASVPSIAPTLATMIGLGVGIDYALFMVSRYRANRKDGMELHEALALTVATSGRAIVFAGSTVVIALVTLLIAGIPLVTSLGYASAFAVRHGRPRRVDPAARGAVADRPAHRLAGASVLHAAEAEAAATRVLGRLVAVRHRPPVDGHRRRRLLLVPLIIPFFSLDLGQEDIGATPKDTQERQAYDLLAAGVRPRLQRAAADRRRLEAEGEDEQDLLHEVEAGRAAPDRAESEQKSGNKQKKQLQQGQQSARAAAGISNEQQQQLEAEQKELESDAAQLQAEQKQS